jgi:spore coat protein CotH
VDPDQSLLEYRTLNLLNAASDPTFLRAVFYSHIAREFLPAPKMNYVRVVINGENWGIYANAQQFNTDFARDWFGTRSGARWKVPGNPRGRAGMEYLGENIDAYRDLYDIRSRDREESWADLIEMFRVLNQTPAEQLESELAPLLDVDGVLRFLALEVALVNGDGYWARASDYSIYQDEQGQFHIIPHDINEALMTEGGGGPGGFGGGGRGGFGGGGVELNPLTGLDDSTKPLRSRLLAVPALQERYLGYVREIAENWLDWAKIESLLTDYRDLIGADVARDTRKLYSTEAFNASFDGPADSLKSFVDARREYLLGER